jgi:ring-1,2-phenylacetyl-CoA epoxidase subunit PaaE
MSKFYPVKIAKINKETADSVSIAFNIDPNHKDVFQYTPGQYIVLKANINGEECRRSYSICSSKNELLTVAIKKVENGKMSTFINDKLKEGDQIEIQPPQGNFQLQDIAPSKTRKFVAFAAGSGITPILSMIKELSLNEKGSEFLLFYGNKTTSDVMFHEELNSISNNSIKVKYLYSRQNSKNELYNGRIDESKAKELLKSEMSYLNSDAFYLCGPEEMIFSTKKVLESFGVDNSKIKFELFTTPVLEIDGIKKETNVESSDFDGESKVTVIYDDEEVEFLLQKNGDTILDAAMDNDLDVPFSCKGAVCCTCRAKVKVGKVSMDANYALSDQEVEDGYILTCQSHPNSEKVIIDFD